MRCAPRRLDFPTPVPHSSFRGLASALASSRSFLDPLLSLFLPTDCRVCEQPLEALTAVPVCNSCLTAPQPYRGTECGCCGLFLQTAATLHGTLRCALCRRNTFVFEQARSFAAYEGVLRTLIQRLKYDGYRPLARPLGRFMAAAAKRLDSPAFDLVLPVPLHSRRQRERGFNQAALLASEVSKLLNVPLGTRNCVRVRDTRPQTGLRAAERRKNVAGAFHVPYPQRVRGLRVLLLDDVLTTGATAHACAQALREAGASGVWVATLARAHAAWTDVV